MLRSVSASTGLPLWLKYVLGCEEIVVRCADALVGARREYGFTTLFMAYKFRAAARDVDAERVVDMAWSLTGGRVIGCTRHTSG
jgi:hypothetical protein